MRGGQPPVLPYPSRYGQLPRMRPEEVVALPDSVLRRNEARQQNGILERTPSKGQMKLCVNGRQNKARTPTWLPLKFVPLKRNPVTGGYIPPGPTDSLCALCMAKPAGDRSCCEGHNRCIPYDRIDANRGYWALDTEGEAATPASDPAAAEPPEPIEEDDPDYEDDEEDEPIIW